MLTEEEYQVLEVIGKNLLIRKDELMRILKEKGFGDGLAIARKLTNMGYVKFVEAVGYPCFTVTQSGQRALSSMK
ncbi:MAG: hypothetical protein J7K72_01195 [Candidatus Aenigmarchaeota archaeon]|nr:hypothetical protein [Candidatus Aenigmarchaeota archaeon]